jgi:hypothetical protein
MAADLKGFIEEYLTGITLEITARDDQKFTLFPNLAVELRLKIVCASQN